MKQKEITEIVNQHFDAMNKLFHKINSGFNTDDIHDFRIEVKELRAFLRLLAAGWRRRGPLIPMHIKTFYGYVGIIRNIQLHRHNLFKYIGDNKIEKPEEYLKLLGAEENYWKKEVATLLKESFEKNEEKAVIKNLPDKLGKPGIRKFIKSKLNSLKKELHDLPNDEAVHSIRKILKDFLYTHKYITDHADLPGTISDKEDLKILTAQLGDFRDKCIQIEFLQREYLNPLKSESEKSMLNKLKEQLIAEKQALAEEVSPRFDELAEKLPVK
ncbi:MAG TPA: CHAD domain-containing protein [Chitinophagaceae bacterium]|nr:CHAD domain-containing protein [Chitinophagaceae bacterium]